MNPARILCFFGSHDWTAWRRPASKPPVGPVIKTVAQFQHRRCKRCGRKESRGLPFVMPDNVSTEMPVIPQPQPIYRDHPFRKGPQ